MTVASVAVLATCVLAAPGGSDPFVAYAHTKLERGCPQWMDTVLRDALTCGVTATQARVTNYCDKCDPSGTAAAGGKLYVGMCAANPELPFGSIVWVQDVGLLRVRDRGGLVKLWVKTRGGGRKWLVRGGETANIDVYVGAQCPGGCNMGLRRQHPIAVVQRPARAVR